MGPEFNSEIELRLTVTEYQALLLIGCVRERANEVERYRQLLSWVDPERLEDWEKLARAVARSVNEAVGRRARDPQPPNP
jgi:hypothetical protein